MARSSSRGQPLAVSISPVAELPAVTLPVALILSDILCFPLREMDAAFPRRQNLCSRRCRDQPCIRTCRPAPPSSPARGSPRRRETYYTGKQKTKYLPYGRVVAQLEKTGSRVPDGLHVRSSGAGFPLTPTLSHQGRGGNPQSGLTPTLSHEGRGGDPVRVQAEHRLQNRPGTRFTRLTHVDATVGHG